MKKTMRTGLLLMLMGLLLLTTACGAPKQNQTPSDSSGAGTSSPVQSDSKEKVTLHIATQFAGVDPKAPWFNDYVVETFNERYGDEINLEIEEIAGEQNYVDKMRLLLSNDQLPDIVHPAQTITREIAEAGKAVDLTPYLDANPEIRDIIAPKTLARNTIDGKVWGLPFEGSWIGLYYNKELLDQAGAAVPATWDELLDACEKLRAAGIEYPMSFETATNAWTASLMFSALVGSSGSEGYDFMNTYNSMDFNQPYIEDAFTKITELLSYAAPDAIGGDYNKASMHFFNSESAFIANGTWMISEFSDPARAPEGFVDKVGVCAFPGNVALKTPMDGWVITAKDPAVQDAAWKFLSIVGSAEGQLSHLEYTATLPDSDKLEMTDAAKEKYPLLSEMYDALQGAQPIQYFSKLWSPAVVDALSNSYPALVYGQITPAEACQALTDAAAKG